jgi:hypothetical protein
VPEYPDSAFTLLEEAMELLLPILLLAIAFVFFTGFLPGALKNLFCDAVTGCATGSHECGRCLKPVRQEAA